MNIKINKKIILGVIALTFLASSNSIKAADPLLHAWSTSTYKNAEDAFDVFISVNPVDEKVCVVKGEINLSNLSCQKITLSDGLSFLVTPSCDDLNFVVGIKGCATTPKRLFTINVIANNAGISSAEFTDVGVFGVGVAVPFVTSGVNHTITSTASSCVCDYWGDWQDESCGTGTCSLDQLTQTRSRTCVPANCDTENINRCIESSECASDNSSVVNDWDDSGDISNEPEDSQASEEKNNFLANLTEAWGKTTKGSIVMITVFSSIILVTIFGIRKWRDIKKKNRIKKY